MFSSSLLFAAQLPISADSYCRLLANLVILKRNLHPRMTGEDSVQEESSFWMEPSSFGWEQNVPVA